MKTFSHRTDMEVSRLVQRVAQKIGYPATNTDDFYGKNAGGGFLASFKRKTLSSAEQFAQELTEFIYDCMGKLISKGATEEQALSIMQDNFSNEKLSDSLNEFFKEYGGSEMERNNRQQYSKGVSKKEVVLMFYVAFVLVGLGFGAMIGKSLEAVGTGTGILCGILIGLGLGVVTHGVVILESLKDK